MKTKQHKATIEEFLRTGRLGQLKLGMSYTELIDYLGLPSNTKGAPDKLYTQWSTGEKPGLTVNLLYGNLAIFLLDHIVVGITLYFREQDMHFLPPILQADWLEYMYQMNTQRLRAFLIDHQILAERTIMPWEEEDQPQTINLYIPSSGAEVIIDLEDGADLIYLISLTSLSGRVLATVPWE